MLTEEIQELLRDLDPETKTLIAEVDMGMQARQFCESDLGRYIIGCAHQEIADAQRELKGTSPWRFWKVQELQNKIWRAESLLLWLRDLIQSGYAANQTVQEVEDGDGN